MNEKKVMFLIFGLVVLVALIGVILFFNSEKTGEFSVNLPVNIRSSKASSPVKTLPVKVINYREPPKPAVETKIKAVQSEYMENCCLWKNNGMVFHISNPAVKYLNFNPSKTGTDELFNKNDLEFETTPYFYNTENLCVKGGTPEDTMAGTVLCIQSYKGVELIPKAGLLCYDNRWWLAGTVCGEKGLATPNSPPATPE
jgi:hypothetical protein